MKKSEKDHEKYGDKNEFFNKSKLKERGWTETMIKKFLRYPDQEVSNPIYKSASSMKLYSIKRIEKAEQSEDFIIYKKKAEKRSRTMKDITTSKKEKLLEKIDLMEFKIKIISMDSLLNNAIRNYNDFHESKSIEFGKYDFIPVTNNSEEKFLERIMVNYVRHRLTTYDRQLEMLAGKIGVREAVLKIKCRIFDEISKSYPELKSECDKQKLNVVKQFHELFGI
ncbi:MAG: hypothetical protein M1529_06425 [Candidatus Thermoplasmatota archaeon]|jgi:hypothetical protein|nr:hypothetical protein [Candidatus Thermoplasmatota archaeon]